MIVFERRLAQLALRKTEKIDARIGQLSDTFLAINPLLQALNMDELHCALALARSNHFIVLIILLAQAYPTAFVDWSSG